jgi:hypothetical protein
MVQTEEEVPRREAELRNGKVAPLPASRELWQEEGRF